MTGHLFLGGPVHGEWHELGGTPSRWEVAVCPAWLLHCFTADPAVMEEVEVTRYGYEPMVVRKNDPPGTQCTVYVPSHMSEDAQWELVKALGLGEVGEG